MKTHAYIVDVTPDKNGHFFKSPFEITGKTHSSEQDNEYYERFIAGRTQSDTENIGKNVIRDKLLCMGIMSLNENVQREIS